MRTDELIVELARAAHPVRPLAPPLVRMARWTAAALPMTALSVIVIGPRADTSGVASGPAFTAVAAATLGTALLAAIGAFMLSVPGAERSSRPRIAPLVAGGVWALGLGVWLTTEDDPLQRLIALPFHALCLIEIVGLSLLPGWMLFAMLRRAAPLRRAWTAALATLAAVALGGVATQYLCPLHNPAHQLVGHLLPVACLAVGGSIVGRRWLNWPGGASLIQSGGRGPDITGAAETS
ncbi:MAG: DUF1109 domain-containing protein [Acidobacteriota bacterium]